jgi:hypothetical protein
VPPGERADLIGRDRRFEWVRGPIELSDAWDRDSLFDKPEQFLPPSACCSAQRSVRPAGGGLRIDRARTGVAISLREIPRTLPGTVLAHRRTNDASGHHLCGFIGHTRLRCEIRAPGLRMRDLGPELGAPSTAHGFAPYEIEDGRSPTSLPYLASPSQLSTGREARDA